MEQALTLLFFLPHKIWEVEIHLGKRTQWPYELDSSSLKSESDGFPSCPMLNTRRSVVPDPLQPCGLYPHGQAPLSMGFSRQEYWSGQPIPSPGDLSNPGIEPRSPTLQADSTIWAIGEGPGQMLWLMKNISKILS